LDICKCYMGDFRSSNDLQAPISNKEENKANINYDGCYLLLDFEVL
jgi:hypothetical protein